MDVLPILGFLVALLLVAPGAFGMGVMIVGIAKEVGNLLTPPHHDGIWANIGQALAYIVFGFTIVSTVVLVAIVISTIP